MSERPSRSSGKQSNSYKHGLTSRTVAARWFDDAKRLAEALARSAPRQSPDILYTVEQLVEQLFFLQAVRAEKRNILTKPCPPKGYEALSTSPDFHEFRQKVIDSGFLTEGPYEMWALQLIEYVRFDDFAKSYVPTRDGSNDLLCRRVQEYRRLDNYERRARSRIKKLVQNLDYWILEEWRLHFENIKRKMRT